VSFRLRRKLDGNEAFLEPVINQVIVPGLEPSLLSVIDFEAARR